MYGGSDGVSSLKLVTAVAFSIWQLAFSNNYWQSAIGMSVQAFHIVPAFNMNVRKCLKKHQDKPCYIAYSNSPSVIDQSNLRGYIDWSITRVVLLLDNILAILYFYSNYGQSWNYLWAEKGPW